MPIFENSAMSKLPPHPIYRQWERAVNIGVAIKYCDNEAFLFYENVLVHNCMQLFGNEYTSCVIVHIYRALVV